MSSNPNAMLTVTNEFDFHQLRADARRRRLVGRHDRQKPAELIDWLGRPWTPQCGRKAAHPNARFTAPAAPVPGDRARMGSHPNGVPIDAILFGGRRAQRRAARYGSVRLAARHISRRHDDAAKPRRRPPAKSASFAAIRWRCCRSAATTWATTSPTGCKIGETPGAKLPGIYYVNWFRQDENGQFPVARLRREQPRPEVDLRAPRRPRRARRRRRSASCRMPPTSTSAASTSPPKTSPACCMSMSRPGRPNSRRSASTSTVSATGCRRGWRTSSPDSRSVWRRPRCGQRDHHAMEPFRQALVQYPVLALFLTIGAGYLLGEISIFGFRSASRECSSPDWRSERCTPASLCPKSFRRSV